MKKAFALILAGLVVLVLSSPSRQLVSGQQAAATVVQKWEYKIVGHAGLSEAPDEIQVMFNKLAAEGWEFCASVTKPPPVSKHPAASVFKRVLQ